jgi:hypothetical protein
VNLADKATECCLACGSAPNEAGSSPPSSQVRLTPLALLRTAAEPVLVAPAGCASRARVLTLWWFKYAQGRLFGLTGKYGQPVRDALFNGHLSKAQAQNLGSSALFVSRLRQQAALSDWPQLAMVGSILAGTPDPLGFRFS